MPEKMWFGSERRFQWVPCPATGMEVTRRGMVRSLEYDNGRVGIRRTAQSHQQFNVEFPVQDATGLEGLDVFSKFASGFYGDNDAYPLFFADPMNYDQNLFPPNFAAPGLFERGWASIVERAPKTYSNLVTNPSLEVNTTGWEAIAGNGGTATGARFNAGTAAMSGQHVYRVSWTVATSSPSGGADFNGVPVTAGTAYGARGFVKSSKIQRMAVTMVFRDSGGGIVGSTFSGTQVVLAANTWAELSVAEQVAPSGSVTMDIEYRVVAGTSAANWANGDTLQVDAATAYRHATGNYPTYFDGDTNGAAWIGTEHNSVSRIYSTTEPVTITDTAANSYNLPPRSATFNVISIPGAYPTINNQFGEIPYALIPIPPGYTLWLGATGSATGTAVVRVHAFNAPGNPASPALSNTLTLLSATGAVRLNASYSGSSYQYVKVFVQRSTSAAATITLSSMMAQLWPTGVTPLLSTAGGNFIEGKGHRGLKFADAATVESYVMASRHFKGLSTTLVEAQDQG